MADATGLAPEMCDCPGFEAEGMTMDEFHNAQKTLQNNQIPGDIVLPVHEEEPSGEA